MANIYSIILAPNPSPLTGPGTNTIVVGNRVGDQKNGVIVIDPASDDPDHLAAIEAEGRLRGGIERILITHGHPDHVGGATALRDMLGVPIGAYSRQGVPEADEEIHDGMIFAVGDDRLRAVYTPGHRFDHLSFFLEGQRTLFVGDLISSVSSVVIPPPPEGDMYEYMQSLYRLREMNIMEMVPAHGLIISNPQEAILDYVTHRQEREQQIMTFLQFHPEGVNVTKIVQTIYASVDTRLHGFATHSVLAHLLKLEREGKVSRVQLVAEQDIEQCRWLLLS